MVTTIDRTAVGLQKSIEIRESDGLVYITAMAKNHNVIVNTFLSLPKTKEIVSKLQRKGCKAMSVIVGGNYKEQGTWVHPILAIFFLNWIQTIRPSEELLSVEDMIDIVLG